ncbi:hypothetical protein P4O66_019999, partial [Electrophorus voltai]
PGSKNQKADALVYIHDKGVTNPTPKTILPSSCFLAPIRWGFQDDLENALKDDPSAEECPPGRNYVPASLRGTLVEWAHTTLYNRHPGITRTTSMLSQEIVSERGSQFTLQVWKQFCKKLAITMNLSSGYHPQSNGEVEHVNQEILLQSAHPLSMRLRLSTTLFPWDDCPMDIQALDQRFQQSSRTWEVTHVHLQRALHTQQMLANCHRNPNLQLHLVRGFGSRLSTSDLDYPARN